MDDNEAGLDKLKEAIDTMKDGEISIESEETVGGGGQNLQTQPHESWKISVHGSQVTEVSRVRYATNHFPGDRQMGWHETGRTYWYTVPDSEQLPHEHINASEWRISDLTYKTGVTPKDLWRMTALIQDKVKQGGYIPKIDISYVSTPENNAGNAA